MSSHFYLLNLFIALPLAFRSFIFLEIITCVVVRQRLVLYPVFQTWIPIYYGTQPSLSDVRGSLCQYGIGSVQIHMGLFLVSLFCSKVLSTPGYVNGHNFIKDL